MLGTGWAEANARGEVLGLDLAARSFERGLAVTGPDGQRIPIPISATAEVRTAAEMAAAKRAAGDVARAIASLSRALFRGEVRDVVRPHLSPLERRLAEAEGASMQRLAVTRTDFFDGGSLRALELNSTIPAMQAYSDIAAQSWVEFHAGRLGLDPAPFVGALPSNTRALYDALCGWWRQELGTDPASIAVLVRRRDAQITEVEWLVRAWSGFGTETFVVYPDELTLNGDRWFAGQRPLDLVYRHLFVRRLEQGLPGAEAATQLLERPGASCRVFNPPASQLEVKAVFALLSEAAMDSALADAAGVREFDLGSVIPWTRVLAPGPAMDPDGASVSDLVARVSSDPDRFVLKRSWDYGGRAVFIGGVRQDVSFSERVHAWFGETLGWPEIVARAAFDGPAGWVVQEAVPARRARHLLCTPASSSWQDVFVDLSHYASVGLDIEPDWTGVVRGSMGPVVNIVGGGGVIPLIPSDIAAGLATTVDGCPFLR